MSVLLISCSTFRTMTWCTMFSLNSPNTIALVKRMYAILHVARNKDKQVSLC